MNVLKKAVQGGIDDMLKFAYRRQFHPQSPLTRASAVCAERVKSRGVSECRRLEGCLLRSLSNDWFCELFCATKALGSPA